MAVAEMAVTDGTLTDMAVTETPSISQGPTHHEIARPGDYEIALRKDQAMSLPARKG